jgi:hypothetical protein
MNFIVFCCLHFAYGAATAFAAAPRMRSEGVVLGWPLIVSIAPIALISTPVSGMFTRFAPQWFFAGVPLSAWTVEFERFHFGVLVLAGSLVALSMILGNFIAIASLSRNAKRWAAFPFVFSGVVILLSMVFFPAGIIFVEEGRPLWTHPVGLCLLATILCLLGSWIFVRSRFSSPVTIQQV